MLCQVVRNGSDITVVGWGAQMAILDQACNDAAKVRIKLHKSKIFRTRFLYNPITERILTT